MENYQGPNEHEVVETEYSKVFYRLVGQLENLKKRAEDPSLPEEERKKAQDAFEKWDIELEKEFATLDARDKEERSRRIASKSWGAPELTSKQLGQEPANQGYFIDSQGFVHGSEKEALGSEPDYWQKPKDA